MGEKSRAEGGRCRHKKAPVSGEIRVSLPISARLMMMMAMTTATRRRSGSGDDVMFFFFMCNAAARRY